LLALSRFVFFALLAHLIPKTARCPDPLEAKPQVDPVLPIVQPSLGKAFAELADVLLIYMFYINGLLGG
jgi:hypothetical protein